MNQIAGFLITFVKLCVYFGLDKKYKLYTDKTKKSQFPADLSCRPIWRKNENLRNRKFIPILYKEF